MVVAAPHSMIMLKEGLCETHTPLSLRRIEGVIGSCGLGCLPACAAWTFTPLRTGASGQCGDHEGPL